MPVTELRKLETIKTFCLENADARLLIEADTGFIRSLTFLRAGVDLFAQLRGGIPGYIGGLRVYDERDRAWYEDLNTDFTLSGAAADGGEVRFSKQFAGAPFVLEVTMRMEADALRWRVRARKVRPDVPDRSLRVCFSMPLIAGWSVWGPSLPGAFVFDGMTPFAYNHLQQSYVSEYELILPMVSHFSKDLDVGYSIMEPIDAKVPAARIGFLNEKCFNWGTMTKSLDAAPALEAMNYYIGLVGDRPMETEVVLMFHEGDWRPGLGKVFRRWNEYFVPPNPTMYEHEGVFGGSATGTSPALLEGKGSGGVGAIPQWRAQHVKTFEVHTHFGTYCDYFNEGRDEWVNIIVYERLWEAWGRKKSAEEVAAFIDGHSDRQIVAEITGRPAESFTPEQARAMVWTTREQMKQAIEALADAGISPFWYFNYTDGFRPVVEQRWPESICRNEDGGFTPSGWKMCHNMNSDPRRPFGQFQIESARKIIEEHPRLAGFFLDCFRHFEIDFAHDDGITVVNGKPAYSVNFSYDAAEGVIKKMLHARDMCTFCNKPQTIRSMRWVDGMMLEGNGDRMEEKYFWACLAKPMVFLWTSNENSDDDNCRRAVLHGCFPKYASGAEATARREKYMPLYDALRRRVFCFEADPMRVPKGCRGKLYTVGDDYVAAIINLHIDEGAALAYDKPPHAMFRVARGCDVGRVGIMTADDGEWRDVKFKFNGTFLAVPLDGFSNCAVVKLFVTRSTGKAIGAARFVGSVDSCGDPDSSFSDISEL